MTIWNDDENGGSIYSDLEASPGSSTVSAGNVTYTPSGTGATATDLQTRGRLMVFAHDYGSKMVTTPAADINLAITAVNVAGGGAVFVSGSHTIETAVVMKSNVALVGFGRGTVLTSAQNAGIIQGSSVSNVCVRDLQILGTGAGASQAGVSFTGVTDSLVHNVYVKDVGHDGILLLTDCVGNTVSDCHVDGAGDDGINIGGGSGTSDNTVVGNVVENCTEDGIHVSVGSKRTTVTGNVIIGCDDGIGIVDAESASIFANTIHDCATTGIISASTPDNPYHSIIGNTISECGVGMSLLRCTHAVVSGNNLKDCTTTGILLFTNNDQYDVDQTVNGNTIEGGCSTAGISVNGSKNVTITGNTIAAVTGAGILTNSAALNGCSNLVIAQNTVRDAGTSGIQIGTGTNSDHIAIRNNLIDTATLRGIYYLGGGYLSITGNHCVDCVERGIYLNGATLPDGRGEVSGNTIEGGCSTAGIAFVNYDDVICSRNMVYNIGASTGIRLHSGRVIMVPDNLSDKPIEGDRGMLTSQQVVWFDDFVGDSLDAKWGSQVGSDPQVVAPAILASQLRGIARMTTGDDAAASMAVNGVQLELQTNWQANQGWIAIEVRLSSNSVASLCMFLGFTDQTGTLEMPFTVGGSDALTSDATDAVGVVYDTAADTDNWWLVGVANNVDATKQNSGVAPTNGTAETWRVEVTSGGAATFFRNGTLIGTQMTSAVRSSVGLTPVVAAFSRTNASRNIDIDYIRVQQGLVTAR